MFISDFNLDSQVRKVNQKPSQEVDITEEEDDDNNRTEEVILFNLSDEDKEFIYDNTHYSLKDINDWHRFELII